MRGNVRADGESFVEWRAHGRRFARCTSKQAGLLPACSKP